MPPRTSHLESTRRRGARLAAPLGLVLLAAAASAQDARETFFETRIRPILVERCYGCHSVEKGRKKGGLVLDTRAGWELGGDSGPAIRPGDPEQSLLVRAIRYGDEALRMPPSGRLADADVAALEAWVKDGAFDPRGPAGAMPAAEAAAPATPRAPIDWDAARAHWSFHPPADPAPPAVNAEAWVRSDVDRFILAGLEKSGLDPAPEADRRTLLRRASFALTGLPPTEEELSAFEADRDPTAFEKVVDRLLASPHYGEHQARQWLDLVRYADSNGQDENLAFGHAWRYRDYVVRAFNSDLPYDRFIQEQLAGDLLPEDPARGFDPLIATGVLVLGPKMLAEQDKEKLVMDVVDEQIDVLGRTVLGLTVSCARCHDHKFDPITQRDYTALAGIFKSTATMANLDHVSQWRERPIATAEERAAHAAFEKELKEKKAAIEATRKDATSALAAGVRRNVAAYLVAGTEAGRGALFLEAEESSRGNLAVDKNQWGTPKTTIVRTGNPGPLQFVEYDVTVSDGGPRLLGVRAASGEERPVRILVDGQLAHDAALGMKTGGFHPAEQRWQLVGAVTLRPGRNVLRLEREGAMPHLDKLVLAAPNGGDLWPPATKFAADLAPELVAQWADALHRAARSRDPSFVVWHAFASLSDAGFAARAPEILAALRAERDQGRLGASKVTAALLDGPAPASITDLAARYQALFAVADLARGPEASAGGKPADDDTGLSALASLVSDPEGPGGFPAAMPDERYPEPARSRLAALASELATLEARRPKPLDHALAVQDGKAEDLPVFVRGNHLAKEGAPVPRGGLELLAPFAPLAGIPPGQSGRLELARALTHPEHPLTARVIVNRIFARHFGRGLVASPSNFGRRGDAPTHPELLDRLARDFVRDGWSLKRLHRRLVTSSAWRMSSTTSEVALARDPENLLFSRQRRRRLAAEEIRDAILQTSGALDRTQGGAALEVGNRAYVTNDQSADAARYDRPRRTLYLAVIRNAMADLFTLFDYPDSSVHLEQRATTTVPGQALWFLNSPFVRKESERLAQAVTSAKDPAGRVRRLYEKLFLRAPTPVEIARAAAFVEAAVARTKPADAPATKAAESRAWNAFVQVLLSSNEFAYVD